MGDPIAKQIDDFWGAVNRVTDTFIDGFDGAKRIEHHAQALRARREAPSKSNVLMLERSHFRVEEITDAENGEVSFDVVSEDGERVECKSRAAADKVCRALEASR